MDGRIENWLDDLGLSQYAETFLKNDVDLRALPHLTEADLRELGISLGHRKIILAAIRSFGREPAKAEADAKRAGEGDHLPLQSPPLVEAMEAERRFLTILFCDLVGSTRIVEKLDPEDARDVMRRYQDAVAGSVTRYSGHVAKYLGDGVLAYFGWPTAHEDQAERAVRAGLEALAAVRSVTQPDGTALEARVGIATDLVVVGDLIGASGRESSAVAGHTPNLAARLQQEAEPGQLLIGESTLRLVGGAFVTQDLGEVRLKGVEQPVRLHRVLAEREVDSRFEAVHGAALSPFIGRMHEIGILRERWDLACSGQGQAVFVSGEAGIGKSRLVQVLEEEVSRSPHEVIRLQCSPYHQNSALYPVIQRPTRVAGFTQQDTPEERLQRLETLLTQNNEDVTTVAPVYVKLLSLEALERYEPRELTPQQLKELTLQILVDRLILMSERRPVLLIVEDTHWIDPSTAELLERAIARIAGMRVMMVITHRRDWSAPWAAEQEHVTRLSVGRLSRSQTSELIQAIIGRKPGASLIDDITDRTDGIPLFVEELTRAVLERNPHDPAILDEIPATLQGSLMARLDHLSLVAKEVAQIASAIGREFSRTLLKQVTRLDNAMLDDTFSELLQARLVVRSGLSSNAHWFRHALIQDVAYQTLLTSKRRDYHRRIAEALLAGEPSSVAEAQPELIARHFSEADLPDRAIPFWKLAAERALARSANFEAVDHCQNALRLLTRLSDEEARAKESLRVHLLLGRALENAGRMPEAMVHLRAASNEARAQRDVDAFAEAALSYDNARFLSNEASHDSIALLKETISLVHTEDPQTRCHILSRLARAHLVLGDADGASRYHEKAAKEAHRLNNPDSRFDLLVNRFLLPGSARSEEDGRDWRAQMDELLSLANEVNDDARGRAMSIDFCISAEFGDRQRMDRALVALTEPGESRQRMYVQWIARHGWAMKAILEGDFPGAETHAEAALELGQRTHGEPVEGVYGIQMFTIRREQGRLAEVAPVIKHLLDASTDQSTWKPGFALVACELGHIRPAQRMLDELAENDFTIPVDAKRSTTLAYLAEVCSAVEDRTCAERLYSLLGTYGGKTITAGVTTVCLGAAERYLGLLTTVLEQWQTAERHFEAALELDRRMSALPWLAHSQHDYALMLRRRGGHRDGEHADRLLEQSLETAMGLNMIALKHRIQGTVH
jgi:class 3 adenylate cyclase/tetratricopeptide (TPR) repeat protein/ABC-type transport system involved in cytochrome c biogenesis ATPase subunit